MPNDCLEPPLYHGRKNSWLKGEDAAMKICVAVLYAAGLCQLSTPLAALAACAFSGMVVLFSMPVPKEFWRRMLIVNIFFLFICLTLPIQFEKSAYTVASFWGIHLSKEAFALALIMLLKGNAIGSVVLLFVGTSSLDDNVRALSRLRVPQKFVMLILLTHVNIQLLRREAAKLFLAAELRGFVPRFSVGMLKTYAWLFGMVFVRAWQRSEKVNTAMVLRGFSGIFPLLYEAEVKYANTARWLAMLLGTVAVIVLLWAIEHNSSAAQAFL